MIESDDIGLGALIARDIKLLRQEHNDPQLTAFNVDEVLEDGQVRIEDVNEDIVHCFMNERTMRALNAWAQTLPVRHHTGETVNA